MSEFLTVNIVWPDNSVLSRHSLSNRSWITMCKYYCNTASDKSVPFGFGIGSNNYLDIHESLVDSMNFLIWRDLD